jgi:hypothetical protein
MNETAETVAASDRRCGHHDKAHWGSSMGRRHHWACAPLGLPQVATPLVRYANRSLLVRGLPPPAPRAHGPVAEPPG